MNTVYQLQPRPRRCRDVSAGFAEKPVSVTDFARPAGKASVRKFLDALPTILAAGDFRCVASPFS
jgi:hypothetical protein